MDLASKMIAGRYRLLGRVGQGAAAEVYRAQDTRLDRIVAIKLLRDTYSDDPVFSQRFQNEARAAARLLNPFIVDVYDYDQADGRYFISMAYIEGQNLKDYLAARAPLTEQETRRLTEQLLRGLAAAHKAGLVHRDMKPQNVLVDSNGNLKITDFGIAKAMGDAGITQTGIALGTPHYLSPEQASGFEVTPRSDLYAVGVIMYEMLSGRLPFEGDNPMRVSYSHVFDDPAPLKEVAPHVSDAMAAVVERAMAKDPDDRYTSANDMLAALEATAHSAQRSGATPIPTRNISSVRESPTQQMRATSEGEPHRSRRKYAVLLLLALLILVGGWYIFSNKLPLPSQEHNIAGPTSTRPGNVASNITTTMVTTTIGTRPRTAKTSVPVPQVSLPPTLQRTTPPSPTDTVQPTPTETSTATPSPTPTATLAPSKTPTATVTPTTTPTQQPAPEAQHARIFLNDNQFTGGYSNMRGNRGRSSRWVYSSLTKYARMSATFKIKSNPSNGYATILIEGLDSEDSPKTHILIQINGHTVFNDQDPLQNDQPSSSDYSQPSHNWSSMTVKIPVSYLKTGANRLTITNTERRGGFGEPPWFMLDYAVISF